MWRCDCSSLSRTIKTAGRWRRSRQKWSMWSWPGPCRRTECPSSWWRWELHLRRPYFIVMLEKDLLKFGSLMWAVRPLELVLLLNWATCQIQPFPRNRSNKIKSAFWFFLSTQIFPKCISKSPQFLYFFFFLLRALVVHLQQLSLATSVCKVSFWTLCWRLSD